jgi:hypothetical protein
MSDESNDAVEDRLAALFGGGPEEVEKTEPQDEPREEQEDDSDEDDQSEEGDEDQESDEDQSEPEPDDAEEVEVDGETFRLPPKVAKAVIRHKDYTQKTQEIAEQRRFLETEKQAVQIQQRLQGQFFGAQAEIAALDRAIQHAQHVDLIGMMETDPIKAMQEQHRLSQLKEAKQQKQAELQQSVHQAMQEQQHAVAQMVQQGQQVLSKRIKGWSPEIAKELAAYGTKEGFTEVELSQVYDPRAVAVMWKAMQFDKLQASKPQVMKKAQGKAVYVKPGASKGQQSPARVQEESMRARLKKSGRDEDAEALIFARLTGKRR